MTPETTIAPSATTESDNDAAELASLRDLARREEAGEDISAKLPGSTDATNPKPAAPASAAATTEGNPDPNAKPDPDPTKTETKPDAVKEPSKFEKEKAEKKAKDEERKARSWEALNAEKEQLARERAELTRLRSEAQRPAEPVADEHGRTAADYDRAAKDFRAEGDIELAKRAEATAAKLRAKAAAPAPAREEFNAAAEAAELEGVKPELKDGKNPLTQRVVQIMRDPKLGAHFARKGGVKAAVEFAEYQIGVEGRIQSLDDELKKVTAERDQLRKATAIGEGPAPAGKNNPKNVEDMTDDEWLAHQRRVARAGGNG